MTTRERRKHLQAYAEAARHIDVSHAAILALQVLNSREATQAINILKRGQQRQLKRLDAAAGKLGAQYGHNV